RHVGVRGGGRWPHRWRVLLGRRTLAAAPLPLAWPRVRPPVLRDRLARHPLDATPHVRIVRAVLPGLRSRRGLRMGPGRAERVESLTAGFAPAPDGPQLKR